MRVVLDCPECGYRYTAMWYEPTWLALKVSKKSHEVFCATGIADGYPKLWHEQGVEAEQERIIKLLEGYFKPEEAKSIYPANYEQYLDLIALIKGE